MGIIKLPNVGDVHTMTVTECVRATGNFGEQVKFTDGTDILYLPQSSADQQLKRIFGDEFAYTDCVGNTLTFSRSPNNKRPGAAPYWNIEPATPAKATTSKRLPAPTPEVIGAGATSAVTASPDVSAQRQAIADAYIALYLHVARALTGATPEAVQAATATIWITWDKRGIQPDARAVARVADAPTVRHPAPSGKRLPPPEVKPEMHADDITLPPEDPAHDDLPF